MTRKSGEKLLLILGVTAVLLLASLIGNVILLSLLKRANTHLSETKTLLTDTEYELAQYKSGTLVPEADETNTAGDGETEPLPDGEQPDAEIGTEPSGTEPELFGDPSAEPSEEPTPKPTPKPTATPAPTPAGPYAGSNLDYEPLDSEKFGEQRKAIVACTVDVNIRSGPGTNYNKLASVSSGSELKVSASAYGWYLIEYKNHTYGWISGQYFFSSWMFEDGTNSFLKDVKAAKEYLAAPEKVVVTAEKGANARFGPTTADELVVRLENGDTGVCIAHEGDWRLCNFKGTYCWVHKSNFA